MIKTIHEDKYYVISVDTLKNRAYLKVSGFWPSPDIAPHYLKDWEKACTYLKSGFTLLTDVREAKTYAIAVQKLHEEAQKFVTTKGISHVAEIHNKNAFVNFQAGNMAKSSGMPMNIFFTEEEAEAYLDNLVA